jgi:hypothetical protein
MTPGAANTLYASSRHKNLREEMNRDESEPRRAIIIKIEGWTG